MWKVMLKEIKELLCDCKILFFMIVLLILVFLLLIGLVVFFGGKVVDKVENKVLDYVVIGVQYVLVLVEELLIFDMFNEVLINDDDDIKVYVKVEKVDFVLVILSNFSDDVLVNGQVKFQLYFNDVGLNMVCKCLDKIVDVFLEESQVKVFEILGLNE